MFHRLVLCFALSALTGCGDLGATLQSLWSSPTRYVVVRGDTLGEIAKAHGVTVDQLRSWNGIDGDLIEVDQVILIYPSDDGGLTAQPAPHRTARRTGGRRGGPAPAAGTPEEPERVAIKIDGLAGILGVEGPSGDRSGIADAASGIGRSGAGGGPSSGLDRRGSGLAGEGSAESLDVDAGRARAVRPAPSQVTGTPRLDAGLRMPSAKPCLAGPTDVVGDQGIAVARGLDQAQLRAGLEPVTSRSLSCFEGASGRFTVDLSLVIGCDGRVTDVAVADGGGLPSATLSCVQQTLRHASFDAHARPDGVSVALPLTFEF